MIMKLLSLFISLGGLATQTHATTSSFFIEGYIEKFKNNTTASFALSQAHLDALNALVGEDIYIFHSAKKLYGQYVNTLFHTLSCGLTPEEITRVASFKPPAWAGYLLFPFAREKSDSFIEGCTSLMTDCEQDQTLFYDLFAHLAPLSDARLSAIAAVHFTPFMLPKVVEEGADIEDARLLQLSNFLSVFFVDFQPTYKNNETVSYLLSYFRKLSATHVQCIIDTPLGPYSFDKYSLFLTNADFFSPDVLGLIPTLFQTHTDHPDLFFHLRHENPSFERLSHITQLPRFLQASYFVSGIRAPSQEEEALHKEISQTVTENEYVDALNTSQPTLHELSQLVSLRLSPGLRVAALYAKDFIPLEKPNPERLALFITLLEGCSPFDANEIAAYLLKTGPVERLYAFRDLVIPAHLRSAFLASYLHGEIPLETMGSIVRFLSSYPLPAQISLSQGGFLSALSLQPEESLTLLGQMHLNLDALKDILRYKKQIPPHTFQALKQVSDLDEYHLYGKPHVGSILESSPEELVGLLEDILS